MRNSPNLSAIVPPEHVYAFSLPIEAKKEGFHPVILVTDIRGLYNKFASDQSYGAYRTVQIQGWFDTADVNADKARRLVDTELGKQRWFNTYDGGWDVDPDTSELYFTTQYTTDTVSEDKGE